MSEITSQLMSWLLLFQELVWLFRLIIRRNNVTFICINITSFKIHPFLGFWSSVHVGSGWYGGSLWNPGNIPLWSWATEKKNCNVICINYISLLISWHWFHVFQKKWEKNNPPWVNPFGKRKSHPRRWTFWSGTKYLPLGWNFLIPHWYSWWIVTSCGNENLWVR